MISFENLFWDIWTNKGYQFPKDHHNCYTFEMVSTSLRIVVGYADGNELFLISARDLTTLEELIPSKVAELNGWKCAPILPTMTLEQSVELTKQMNPFKCEGFIFCDKSFQRVKVKSPQWICVSNATTRPSRTPPPILTPDLEEKQYIELIRAEDTEELLQFFPKCKDDLERYQAQYLELIQSIQWHYDKVKYIQDSSQFAKGTFKKWCTFLLFNMRNAEYLDVWTYMFMFEMEEFEIAQKKLIYRRNNHSQTVGAKIEE